MEPYRGSESSGNLSFFLSSLYSPQSERYIARGGIFLCNFSKDEFRDAFVWTNEFQNFSVLPGFLSLFFSFPYSFSFFFSLSWTREGRKEGKQSLDRWREVKGEERAEVLEDGQAFLDRRQKTSSRLGSEKEGSWKKVGRKNLSRSKNNAS